MTWADGKFTNVYRVGHKGKVDLKCVGCVPWLHMKGSTSQGFWYVGRPSTTCPAYLPPSWPLGLGVVSAVC